MTEHELARFHAMIDGRVQGVGFRYFVQENASALGIRGWVRNRYDGQVEVIAEGEKQILENLIEQLHRGPRGSYVTQVDINWETASREFNSFEVRRSF